MSELYVRRNAPETFTHVPDYNEREPHNHLMQSERDDVYSLVVAAEEVTELFQPLTEWQADQRDAVIRELIETYIVKRDKSMADRMWHDVDYWNGIVYALRAELNSSADAQEVTHE